MNAMITRVDIPLFGGQLLAFYGYEHTLLIEEMKSLNFPVDWIAIFNKYKQNTGGAFYSIPDKSLGIIWTREKDVSTLAHECAHAVFAILDDVGVNSMRGNNETFCYLLDHIIEVILSNDKDKIDDKAQLFKFLNGVSETLGR